MRGWRGGRGRWGRPPCSRNARPEKALVGRAQPRPTPPPSPFDGGEWMKEFMVALDA